MVSVICSHGDNIISLESIEFNTGRYLANDFTEGIRIEEQHKLGIVRFEAVVVEAQSLFHSIESYQSSRTVIFPKDVRGYVKNRIVAGNGNAEVAISLPGAVAKINGVRKVLVVLPDIW